MFRIILLPACMGEERIVYRILIRSLDEIGCWEDLGVDGRIILTLRLLMSYIYIYIYIYIWSTYS